MGKLSRTKGHSFEREVANLFQKIGYPNARRQLEYNSRDANGVDLQEVGPWAVQCKRGRKYASITAINEVDTTKGVPVLITKGDNIEAMAVMKLDTFLQLARLHRIMGSDIEKAVEQSSKAKVLK